MLGNPKHVNFYSTRAVRTNIIDHKEQSGTFAKYGFCGSGDGVSGID